MVASLVILQRKSIVLSHKKRPKTSIFEHRPQCSPKPVGGDGGTCPDWALGPGIPLRCWVREEQFTLSPGWGLYGVIFIGMG